MKKIISSLIIISMLLVSNNVWANTGNLNSNKDIYRVENNNAANFLSQDNLFAKAEISKNTEKQSQKILAISDFVNDTGDKSLDYLKQALPNSLITSLASDSDNQVSIVERGQFQAIIKEMGFGNSGFIDVSTATKVGSALGATYVIVGGLAKADSIYRLNVRVIDVKTSKVFYASSQYCNSLKEVFSIIDKASVNISAKLLGDTKKAEVEPNIPQQIIDVKPVENSQQMSLLWTLNFIIPGLGQMFLGELLRGIIFFGAEAALVTLFIGTSSGLYGPVDDIIYTIAVLGVYVWSITDAYRIAYEKSQKISALEQDRITFMKNLIESSDKVVIKNNSIAYRFKF